MTGVFILGHQVNAHRVPFTDTATLCKAVGQNTGNLAFQSAIDCHLGGNLPAVGWGFPPERIDANGSLGVFAAANQFSSHVDYSHLAESFSRLKCRIVMIGLGTQSDVEGTLPAVPEGTVAWVQVIAAHGNGRTPNISVRGEFTKQVLDHYGLGDHAVVLGCPSLFLNPATDLGVRIASNVRPIRRVAVAAGLQHWRDLWEIERSLVRIVTETNGSYVGQHDLVMQQLTRGEASQLLGGDLRLCRDALMPDVTLDDFIGWSELYGNVFFDVFGWMEHYRHFDFVIGARIHGVMLGLQAGVPSVCVAHDSRTLELCRTMMVPYVLAKDVAAGIQREQLSELFSSFDPQAFDANRRALAEGYVTFLEANGLKPVAWLKAIAVG